MPPSAWGWAQRLGGCAVRPQPSWPSPWLVENSVRPPNGSAGQPAPAISTPRGRNCRRWSAGTQAQLDASAVSAAVIESVAENSVDAVIAPVFWAVVAGPTGAAAYRAINTMDAMVGHRNDRYSNFGWAAARLDDAANYVPARIFAALVAAQTPAQATKILATVRRDAPAHPSPNAGVAENGCRCRPWP